MFLKPETQSAHYFSPFLNVASSTCISNSVIIPPPPSDCFPSQLLHLCQRLHLPSPVKQALSLRPLCLTLRAVPSTSVPSVTGPLNLPLPLHSLHTTTRCTKGSCGAPSSLSPLTPGSPHVPVHLMSPPEQKFLNKEHLYQHLICSTLEFIKALSLYITLFNLHSNCVRDRGNSCYYTYFTDEDGGSANRGCSPNERVHQAPCARLG